VSTPMPVVAEVCKAAGRQEAALPAVQAAMDPGPQGTLALKPAAKSGQLGPTAFVVGTSSLRGDGIRDWFEKEGEVIAPPLWDGEVLPRGH
jgi:hypothetical protein